MTGEEVRAKMLEFYRLRSAALEANKKGQYELADALSLQAAGIINEVKAAVEATDGKTKTRKGKP